MPQKRFLLTLCMEAPADATDAVMAKLWEVGNTIAKENPDVQLSEPAVTSRPLAGDDETVDSHGAREYARVADNRQMVRIPRRSQEL